MCTVSYLPKDNGDFIFTCNRDEDPSRATKVPRVYEIDEAKYVYPKDEIAGGTWLAMADFGRVVCLLNGAYEAHERKLPYRYSRGLVVKKVLEADNPKWVIEALELEGVEPFTLIVLDWSFMPICIELIWDGVKKDIRILSHQAKIWSSSTLYDKPVQQERRKWFKDFLLENTDPSVGDVLRFHKSYNAQYPEKSVFMKRAGVETRSITSIEKRADQLTMTYHDVLTGTTTEVTLPTN